MTLYLNQIYFGRGRYGVQEAARFYFGKDVGQVDAGEAAVLAALPKEPETCYRSLRGKNPRAREGPPDLRAEPAGRSSAADHAGRGAEVDRRADPGRRRIRSPSSARAPEWVDLVEEGAGRRRPRRGRASTRSARRCAPRSIRRCRRIAQKALQAGLRAVDKRHGDRPRGAHAQGRQGRGRAREAREAAAERRARSAQGYLRGGRHGGARRRSASSRSTSATGTAALVLGDEDDARFNPPDADGKTKKPSERFKLGDVVEVVIARVAGEEAPTTTTTTSRRGRSREARASIAWRSRRGPRARS